jgi:hypothetical protein
LIVCPCCGFKFLGNLLEGCVSCGARAVGEPLAPPERELPLYGRALTVGAMGGMVLIALLGSTAGVLIQRWPPALGYAALLAAGETAAWRLKWVGLPAALLALFLGRLIYSTIRRMPVRFAGKRIAQGGLLASALVAAAIVTLIGVSVPERLRQRQRAFAAAYEARLYRVDRALLEYRMRFETLPATLKDLQDRSPDADGSLVLALAGLGDEAYKPTTELALGSLSSLPKTSTRTLHSSVLRRSPVTPRSESAPAEGITLTSYELHVPGDDYKANPKDEWIIRDGMIVRPSPTAVQASPSPTSDQ